MPWLVKGEDPVRKTLINWRSARSLGRLLPIPRMRGAERLRLLVLGAVMVGAGLPAAAQDPGAALIAQLRGLPVPEGWTLQEQGDATVLRNASGGQPSHMVFYRPAPAGGLIRSTLLVANLASEDPKAHIGVMLVNGDGLCMLVLFGMGDAELNCSAGETFTPIGSLQGALKLDGSDRIQILEFGKEAIFHVNRQEIGRIADHSALDGDFGLVFSGRGDFAINTFSVAHMTEEDLRGPSPAPPPAPPPPAPPVVQAPPEVQAPPVVRAPPQPPGKWTSPAADFPAVPARAGWQDVTDAAGITLINEASQGDERTVPLSLPPLQGSERLTQLDVSIAPSQTGQQSLRAAGGLLLENVEQGQSCGLQITAAGDGLLLCYASDGRGIEVGRQTGIATGAGPHRLSILERGDELSAQINGTVVGTLKAHPVIGGDMSLIAWDRGSFTFSALQRQAESLPAASPPARLEPRPAGSLGDHLQGPLPLFGGDQPRADAAYLGVTKSILMHELGHALIGELGVPATGPEEDAVDIYAALHLAETVAQSSANPALASDAASYASLLWYYSGRLEEQQNIPASEGWQDEHTGGLKRFRNMFCVIYGADPRGFSQLAQAVGLEERTLARCEEEFLKQHRAWRAILSPYARLSPAMPEGRLPADAAGAKIEVEFQPSNRQIGEYMRRNYQAELTRVAQALGQAYVLPRPVRVVFQDCDAVNAWYYPKEGSVTMCYDIIEHFIVMTSDIELATQGGYSAAELGQLRAPAGQTAVQPMAGQLAQAQEELTDFGIPTSLQFFSPPFHGPTPVANPKARTITTPEVKALIETVPEVLIFDIRDGIGLQSLPGAWQLQGAGRDGSLQDSLQLRLGAVLADMAGANKDRPIIVLGEGPDDRAAWNAAMRIGQEGYASNWYRGGVTAWRAAGHALSALQ